MTRSPDTSERLAAWGVAQTDAYLAFLDRHGLDLEYAEAEMTPEQRAELDELEASIDAEHGYDPTTFTFR